MEPPVNLLRLLILSLLLMIIKAKKEGVLIMGIGHRVKSINNPDKRVTHQ